MHPFLSSKSHQSAPSLSIPSQVAANDWFLLSSLLSPFQFKAMILRLISKLYLKVLSILVYAIISLPKILLQLYKNNVGILSHYFMFQKTNFDSQKHRLEASNDKFQFYNLNLFNLKCLFEKNFKNHLLYLVTTATWVKSSEIPAWFDHLFHFCESTCAVTIFSRCFQKPTLLFTRLKRTEGVEFFSFYFLFLWESNRISSNQHCLVTNDISHFFSY